MSIYPYPSVCIFPGSAGAETFVLPEDKTFKERQKERVREIERQEEFDHMLKMRELVEYNDDYDDQVRKHRE
jgi:hypothetical protein